MKDLMNNIHLSDYKTMINRIPNASVDLVFVDPPYFIDYKEWDRGHFVEFTREWLKEAKRILKPTGTLVSFMGYERVMKHKNNPISFIELLEEVGIVHLENMVIWMRQKGRGSSKHLKSQREDIIHCTMSDKYTWNNLQTLREVVAPYVKDGRPRGWFLDSDGMRKRWTGLGNVWTYSAPQWNGIVEKQWHPAQKPIMICERIIRLTTNEDDIVVDFFGGSGSIGIACKLSNRNFIMFENHEVYYKTALQRLNNFKREDYVGYNDSLGESNES